MDITDKNRPVTFELPDGHDVVLVPWEYILDRLTIDLEPTVNQMKSINVSLKAIDDKLSEWVEEG